MFAGRCCRIDFCEGGAKDGFFAAGGLNPGVLVPTGILSFQIAVKAGLEVRTQESTLTASIPIFEIRTSKFEVRKLDKSFFRFLFRHRHFREFRSVFPTFRFYETCRNADWAIIILDYP